MKRSKRITDSKNPGLKKQPLSKRGIRLCILAFTLATLLFSSCSIKYGNSIDVSENTPEITFSNAVFSRYEQNKIRMQLKTTTLEQYKKDPASYADNAQFQTWAEDGSKETSGNCRILSLDTKNEKYSLYKSIELKNEPENLYIIAENLKYDGKTRQLTSGISDTVYLQRDDVEITGTGFSASGISKSYSFQSGVFGTIITDQGAD